jgi:hypothetical protein
MIALFDALAPEAIEQEFAVFPSAIAAGKPAKLTLDTAATSLSPRRFRVGDQVCGIAEPPIIAA